MKCPSRASIYPYLYISIHSIYFLYKGEQKLMAFEKYCSPSLFLFHFIFNFLGMVAPQLEKTDLQGANDLENCLVSSRINNLPGFNWSPLPNDMGNLLQKAPFKSLQKLMKTKVLKFHWFSSLATMTFSFNI